MNVQPIGYQYPQNYVNMNVAPPGMDLTQCKKHTMYECDGTFYVKQPSGCQFVTDDSSNVITSHYRRRYGSPYLGRFYSPHRRFGLSPYRQRYSPYRRPIGSPYRRPVLSPQRPIGSPYRRR